MSTFNEGDRVAWSHGFSTQHAPGSIVHASAVPTLDEQHPLYGEPGSGQLGTVLGVANDEGTYYEVQLDDSKDSVVLTEDELVKVHEPDA